MTFMLLMYFLIMIMIVIVRVFPTRALRALVKLSLKEKVHVLF